MLLIIKLFGLLDLLSAVFFILAQYSFGITVAYFFVGYLFVKGLLFFGDWNSFMDIISSIFLLLATQDLFFFFNWLFIVYLLQKSFFSLLAA